MKQVRKTLGELKLHGKKAYTIASKYVKQSIRLEILVLIAIAFLASTIGGFGMKRLARAAGVGAYTYVSYEEGVQELQNNLLNVLNRIGNMDRITLTFKLDTQALRNAIENEAVYEMREVVKNAYETPGYGYMECWDKLADDIGQWQPLYDQLRQLLGEGGWEGIQAQQVVQHYVEKELGITLDTIKKLGVKRLIYELSHSSYLIEEMKTYLVDGQGNAVFKDDFVQKIDIIKAIEESAQNSYETQKTSIYPVILDGEIYYLFNESKISGSQSMHYSNTANVLGILVGIIIFVILMFYFTKEKLRYIEYISHCLGEISKGDLAYKVEVRGSDELAKVAADIAYMEGEILTQIEAQKQAEKTKNELITNVAHDLRTPLTSIIGYIGLVREGKYENPEELARYLDIAYTKSEKLKVLIEDLFEYTKLTNQSVKLDKHPISMTNLLNQLIEELLPQAEEKQVMIKMNVEATDTTILADIGKLMRVFENLVENAIKYTLPSSLIYIAVQEEAGQIYVSIRNQCRGLTSEDTNRMFDRFYRSDASRNSSTGGSGLGLAIAKNIVQLHQGDIWAQLNGNIISLNVRLPKKVVE